jgi:molybdopterin synthase catalytic subunit
MGTVTVRLFARLADLAGTRSAEVELGEGLSAADVFAALAQRYPGLVGLETSVMYARNQEYVPGDAHLAPGDELALIPPVSGGADLFEVIPEPLDPQRVVDAVRCDEAGAVALFYGVVRDNNRGRRVLYLEYDAYPEMATKVMREIAGEIAARFPVTRVAIQHRTGRLEIGETSLLVAVSSPHRAEAFNACHALVDRFKEVVPIWKKEVFAGGEEWLEGDVPA